MRWWGFGDAEALFGRVLAGPGTAGLDDPASRAASSSGSPTIRAPRGSARPVRIPPAARCRDHRPVPDHRPDLATGRGGSDAHGTGDEGRSARGCVVPCEPVPGSPGPPPFPIATRQPGSPACISLRCNGVLDQCMETGTTPLAWSPIGGGRLAMDIDAARAQGDASLWPFWRSSTRLRRHRVWTGSRSPSRGSSRTRRA